MNYRQSFRQFLAPLQLFFFFPVFQEAIPQGLSHWSPCYGSVLGPTSSPTACPLLLLAVLLRPWTCSWRVMPSSSLWLPRLGGMVPAGVDQRGRDGSHIPFCLLLPTSLFSFLAPLPQHPPSVSSALSRHAHFPTSLCLSSPCQSPTCSLGLYFCLFFLPLTGGHRS